MLLLRRSWSVTLIPVLFILTILQGHIQGITFALKIKLTFISGMPKPEAKLQQQRQVLCEAVAVRALPIDYEQSCGRFGHIARACPNGTGTGYVSRAPPPGRSLNTSTLPTVKCHRCGGPNHFARSGH